MSRPSGQKPKPPAPIPSLADLEGVASDAFMEVVDTWPHSRVSVLEKTRVLLNNRFAQLGSRNIRRLEDLFAALRPVGRGAFGEVSKACVRKWDKSNRPSVPPTCVQYSLLGQKHEIFLIVKTLKPLAARLLGDVPYAGHTAAFDDWFGDRNSVREVMMGRLLNLLVVHGATPHFPLIYEPFTTSEPVRNAFVMELAHMSFINFLSSKMLSALPTAKALELLDVAILQLCNGLLCAHKHYDFRHNDLHLGNAMMTFITDTMYVYKVGGVYFEIPNYGMCWKLIDFGMSASRVFDKDDIAHAVMHSGAMQATEYMEVTDYAMEFFDLLKLVTFAGSHIHESRPRTRTKDAMFLRLVTYLDAMQDISRASVKRGSLQKAANAFVPWEIRGRVKLARTTKQFSHLMRSSGLLEQLFHKLGARFIVPEPPRDGVVFDADISPFAGEDIVLEGIHDTPIVVSKLPPSAAVSVSVSPTPIPETSENALVSIEWFPQAKLPNDQLLTAIRNSEKVVVLNDDAGNLYTLAWVMEQLSPSYIVDYFRCAREDVHVATDELLFIMSELHEDLKRTKIARFAEEIAVVKMISFLADIAGSLSGPKFSKEVYVRYGVMETIVHLFPADTRFTHEDVECVIHSRSA